MRTTSALTIAAALCMTGTSAQAQASKPITVQWLGHAAFEITSSGGTKLLIDPCTSDATHGAVFAGSGGFKPSFPLSKNINH